MGGILSIDVVASGFNKTRSPSIVTLTDTASISLNDDQLPPQDRGTGAWKCLAGLWLVEAFLWGFPLAFGVFQLYYTSHTAFQSSKSISTVGALALCIPYLGLPLVNALALRFRRYVCRLLCAGWLFCLASLIAASFATDAWQLVLTQGVLFGIAQTCWFSPSVILINDWFNERRGLAFGVLFGASGVSGLILPFVLELACRRYGFRWAIRGFVLVTALVSGPGLLLIKPRVALEAPEGCNPHSPIHRPPRTISCLSKRKWIYPFVLAAFLQSMAYFLPIAFLPSFSKVLDYDHAHGDLLLAINSLAQVSGQILMGHCSDKFHPILLTTASTLLAGAAALLLWGLAKTYLPLVFFSLVWGFCSGSYSVLWYRVCQHVTKGANECTTLYGLISFERGISLLLAGPVSEWLLADTLAKGEFGLGRYKWMIIFVGIATLLSSATGIAYVFEREDREAQDLA